MIDGAVKKLNLTSIYLEQTAKLKELELQKTEVERQKTEVERQKAEVERLKQELQGIVSRS